MVAKAGTRPYLTGLHIEHAIGTEGKKLPLITQLEIGTGISFSCRNNPRFQSLPRDDVAELRLAHLSSLNAV